METLVVDGVVMTWICREKAATREQRMVLGVTVILVGVGATRVSRIWREWEWRVEAAMAGASTWMISTSQLRPPGSAGGGMWAEASLRRLPWAPLPRCAGSRRQAYRASMWRQAHSTRCASASHTRAMQRSGDSDVLAPRVENYCGKESLPCVPMFAGHV